MSGIEFPYEFLHDEKGFGFVRTALQFFERFFDEKGFVITEVQRATESSRLRPFAGCNESTFGHRVESGRYYRRFLS